MIKRFRLTIEYPVSRNSAGVYPECTRFTYDSMRSLLMLQSE